MALDSVTKMMDTKLTEVSSALSDKLTALLGQIQQPSIPVSTTPQHSIHAPLGVTAPTNQQLAEENQKLRHALAFQTVTATVSHLPAQLQLQQPVAQPMFLQPQLQLQHVAQPQLQQMTQVCQVTFAQLQLQLPQQQRQLFQMSGQYFQMY